MVIGARLAENLEVVSSSENAGETYVYFGKKSGYKSSVKLKDLGNDGINFAGEEEDDNSGVSVATAGDIDADGYDDLLIGASFSPRQYAYWGKSSHSSNEDLKNMTGTGTGFFVETSASHVWDGMTVNTAGDMKW